MRSWPICHSLASANSIVECAVVARRIDNSRLQWPEVTGLEIEQIINSFREPSLATAVGKNRDWPLRRGR
ncbi:hypothetical protein IQ25_03907 [Novosphingobium taihuense]|nr:hypothetical protein IQ25_03907 [Novosphingobium taihuense]